MSNILRVLTLIIESNFTRPLLRRKIKREEKREKEREKKEAVRVADVTVFSRMNKLHAFIIP